MVMEQPEKAKCRVCHTEAVCHVGVGGVKLLPFGWDNFEDKTLTRTRAMATVCSEKCKRKLKEMNRQGNNQRTGW